MPRMSNKHQNELLTTFPDFRESKAPLWEKMKITNSFF
jgi:hypothetical protein